ncbi:MAG: protein kinase [Planctomycetes bacterium]|nr:protein kinase [Planctomycetota bacterium]
MTEWLARFDPAGATTAARCAADGPAADGRARFERACARALLGRDDEARADLQACAAELGDAAHVELAHLDVRGRGGVEAACSVLEAVLARVERGSALEARTLHILGLARGKLRRTALATDALLSAADRYRALGDLGALAQVQDTLGSLFAAQGRLDFASAHYAASMVGKLRAGDVAGIAVTLGNLGRLHLRAGRFEEALDCFRLDLELATSLADERGMARMHEDLGRAHMGLERWDEARAELQRALAIAEPRQHLDLVFFARHDLALVELEAGRADEAREHVARAEAALSEPRDAYLEALLVAVRGRLLAVAGDPAASALLEDACERFGRLELPDHEIPARLALAEARLSSDERVAAERDLARALELARLDGQARWLPPVREAMARLSVVESLVDERGRLAAPGEKPAGADGYVLLAQLGKGAFGEVWRAYDPQRARVVALKRLDLERLYDPEKRARRVASARTELAAASALRHPGIARVFAFGVDGAQGAYVVQELIDGESLRARMSRRTPDAPGRVLDTAGRMARALQTLHSAGVVHRDLKPENVILRRTSGGPVLIDFGLALAPGGELAPNAVAGTLLYMAPEQAAGEEVTGAADLYALGTVLYEWWAGRRPLSFSGASFEECVETLRRETPVSLAGLRPDLGTECTSLVDELLRKEPTSRPDVEEVAERCEALAARLLGRA